MKHLIFNLFILAFFSALIANITSCRSLKNNKVPITTKVEMNSILRIDRNFKPDLKPADFTIDTAFIQKDKLCIIATYTGGCCENNFELVWTGSFYKSLPMKAPLQLVHTSSNENCKGLQKYTLHYNISALKQPTNKLVILLSGYTKSELYLGQ